MCLTLLLISNRSVWLIGFALYWQRRKLRGGSKILNKNYFSCFFNSKPCCALFSFIFSSVLVYCNFTGKVNRSVNNCAFLEEGSLGCTTSVPNSGWRISCVGLSCPLGLNLGTENCHFSHSTPGSPHLWNNLPITIHLNTVAISGCCSNFINFKLNWAD